MHKVKKELRTGNGLQYKIYCFGTKSFTLQAKLFYSLLQMQSLRNTADKNVVPSPAHNPIFCESSDTS